MWVILDALEEDMERDTEELQGMDAKKVDADYFMELVQKYTSFEELTPAMLNEFVDKVMVHKAVGKGANRVQDIDIYLNYIGRFVVPEVEVKMTEEEKLAEAKRLEKLEKKRASNRKYMARKREEARKGWAEIEAQKAKVDIGDSLVDAETAKAAQLPFVACTWGFCTKEQLLTTHLDHIVDHPSEILELI